MRVRPILNLLKLLKFQNSPKGRMWSSWKEGIWKKTSLSKLKVNYKVYLRFKMKRRETGRWEMRIFRKFKTKDGLWIFLKDRKLLQELLTSKLRVNYNNYRRGYKRNPTKLNLRRSNKRNIQKKSWQIGKEKF